MMHGHRRGPTLRTYVAVLWATACVLAAAFPWPAAAEGLTPLAAAGPSSAVRPEGYQEQFVQPAGQLANSGAKVLIIREFYGDRPWNNWPESSNVLVLQSFGFTEGTYGAQNTGDKYLIAGMDNSSNFSDIDFSKFQVVIVENDNSQAFFDALATRWDDITRWVADGGVLVFHGAEVSWHGGRYGISDPPDPNNPRNVIRPPGMTLEQSAHNVWFAPPGVLYSNYVDPTAYSEYASITAGMISPTWGNYTSHDVFYNVTESGTYDDGPGYIARLEVLTVDSPNTRRATSFVYRYLKDNTSDGGCVYFGGLTLEWGYYYNYDYGRKMLPQLLSWALSCAAPPPQPTGVPDISVIPPVIDVTLNEGALGQAHVEVKNDGDAELAVENVSFSGDWASWASVEPLSATVSPDSSVPFEVSINPGSAEPGTYRIDMTISSDDPDEPEFVVPMIVEIQGPNIAVAPASLSATLVQGQVDETRTLNIRNVGNRDLNAINLSADVGWISPGTHAPALAPGGHMDVPVRLDATALSPGIYPALLTVSSDDPDGPVSVPVQITVLSRNEVAALYVSPTSLEAQDMVPGEIRHLSLDAINTGNVALDILVGTAGNATWLTVAPTTFSVGPGEVRRLDVTFNAADLSPGDYNASLRMSAPQLESPVEVQATMAVVQGPPPVQPVLGVVPRYISPNDDFMDRGIATINWDILNVSEALVGMAILDQTGRVIRSLLGSGTGLRLDCNRPFGTPDNGYLPISVQRGAVTQASWDGRDESGHVVEEGEYTAVLMAKDDAQRYACATRLVGVDTTPPDVSIRVLSPTGQPYAEGEIPTVYYEVVLEVSAHDELSGINFPSADDPNFARLRPRITVKQANMPPEEQLEVVTQEYTVSADGREATFRFRYRVVKATLEDERAGLGWDGPASVTVNVADRSYAPNDRTQPFGELFYVNTQGPRVAITGVSPGSNAKDDPFRPEFRNGEFTRSRISVRYTANDPNLEGTVYLKIYPGQFQSITREQFDANNPYPIRVLDPISTGALEQSGDGFSKEVTFEWDGRDALGNFVRAGTYTLVAAADTVVPAAEENQAAQVRPSVDTDDERIFVTFPPMSIGELHAFPNPVRSGRPVTFVLDLNRPSEVIVELYSTAGHRINTVSFNGNIGRQEYVWSAVTDADGNPLVNGLYLVKVTVFDEAGAPTFRIGKLVVVR